jgi:prephenate dehydrogenase
MWRDIALHNRDALAAACSRFEATFSALRLALEAGHGAALHAMFSRAKAARDAYLDRSSRP